MTINYSYMLKNLPIYLIIQKNILYLTFSLKFILSLTPLPRHDHLNNLIKNISFTTFFHHKKQITFPQPSNTNHQTTLLRKEWRAKRITMKNVSAYGRNISGSDLGQWQGIHLKNRNESSDQKPEQLYWNIYSYICAH